MVAKRLLLKWGLPPDLSTATWDFWKRKDLDMNKEDHVRYEELTAIAKKWVKVVAKGKGKIGLFMYGMNGSGKSSMGTRILLDLIEKDVKVQRMTMARLQQDFYERWRVPEAGLLRGVLLIDEVGKEYETKQAHAERAFEAILKYRTENRLPTILVTNSNVETLVKFYGETINSLLKGRFIPLAFPDCDLRQATADEEISSIMDD